MENGLKSNGDGGPSGGDDATDAVMAPLPSPKAAETKENDVRRVTRSQTRPVLNPSSEQNLSPDSDSEQPPVKKARRSRSTRSRVGKASKKGARSRGIVNLTVDFVRMGPLDGVEGKKKCNKCLQMLSDVQLCVDPEYGISELMLLDNEQLCIKDNDGDRRPSVRLTMFSVYDEFGHLCPFDTGLIEQNDFLFMNGYAKIIVSEDPSIEDGVPLTRIGPIESWWIYGFDGGGNTLLGFSTDLINYYIMCPAVEYQPFMCMDKVKLSKYVIDYIQGNPSNTFEEMCDHIKDLDSTINDEFILLHAGFLAAQIQSYDSQADWDELALHSTRITRRLITLAGDQGSKMKRCNRVFKTRMKTTIKSATTTPLVCSLLKGFFGGQTNVANGVDKRAGCQNCDACLRSPCNTCTGCKSKSKICNSKKCENSDNKLIMLDEQSDEEDVEDDMDLQVNQAQNEAKRKILFKAQKASKVVWKSAVTKVENGRKYYSSVAVDKNLVTIGDCLTFAPEKGDEPYLGKVRYMYEEDSEKMLHVTWFWQGSDTVLGETSCQSEVFFTYECDSVPAGSVESKCLVKYENAFAYFIKTRTVNDAALLDKTVPGTFHYSRMYNHGTGRFEVAPEEIACKIEELKHEFCIACDRKNKLEQFENLILGEPVKGVRNGEYKSFHLRGEQYAIGECVFLDPKVCSLFSPRKFKSIRVRLPPDNDKETYPERYRKVSGLVCGANNCVPDPFLIGRILSITRHSSKRRRKNSDDDYDDEIRVAIFFRPENTCLGDSACYNTDINMLYWSNQTMSVRFSAVMGKCVVAYADNIEDLESFRLQGPYRFYFKQVYNMERKQFEDVVPAEAKSYSGKGKGKAYEDYPPVPRKLKSLDCFCGSGGLSDGFHRAGISETHWAMENNGPAAEAFKLNNPNCVVYEEDCNELLRMAMEGKTCDKQKQPLPKKGDVDIVMGGPPCQGFSGMNRFNTREYSIFQNSLVATYLSICEYYRPRFFILENVRNFISYKKNMVLKQVMKCLVRIGYQCTFAVLQAGHYGIPQTRRRCIIIAAAPGEKLPFFPEPLNVFDVVGPLSVCIDENKITSNIRWTDSAPYRTVTVNDALSDLPEIKCGASAAKTSYGGPPITHFQKMMRDNNDILKDHVTKQMNDLTMERFRYIPVTPGADWRDLPNIEIIKNGVLIASKLKYSYVAKDGTQRGVCKCADGRKECDPKARQSNTLIPWCLPHTSNRHNQWNGLFGRLSPDGHFCTTITNPEPMGKQGCVIHPTQHRVVSVRECARSQGFTDSYIFSGNVLERYRQVGNAVPPPLAQALGLELRKSLFEDA